MGEASTSKMAEKSTASKANYNLTLGQPKIQSKLPDSLSINLENFFFRYLL